jgi:hypothetical protein
VRLELFVLLVAAVNLVVVLEFVRRRKLAESFALLWSAVAIGGLALVLARPWVDEFARWAGIEAGTSVVFSLAILFLVVVSVYLSVHITSLEERVEVLAEEVALLRGVQPPESTGPNSGPRGWWRPASCSRSWSGASRRR